MFALIRSNSHEINIVGQDRKTYIICRNLDLNRKPPHTLHYDANY